MPEITVREAAERLGITPARARRIIVDAGIKPRVVGPVWLVDSDQIHRLARLPRPNGKRWAPETSWAALYALSGWRTPWLDTTRSYRMRRRLRDESMTGELLAGIVATRTRAYRFEVANPQKAAAGVLPTARAATAALAELDTGLLPDERLVCGYPATGETVEQYADSHFMVPISSGQHVLYEATWPGSIPELASAVVAADLARSSDTREHSAGIAALDRLLTQYRETTP